MAQVTTTPVALIPLFDSKRRKLKRRAEARAQEALRVQLREEKAEAAQEEAKYDTFEFLEKFIEASEFSDQSDQISIAWDVLPQLEELEGYGRLNEVEGTQACRKLFKAVVLWEKLGHSLWKTLRDQVRHQDENTTPEETHLEKAPLEEPEPITRSRGWSVTPRLRRKGSRSSRSSQGSASSNQSPRTSIDNNDQYTAYTISESPKRRSSLPWSTPLCERQVPSGPDRRSTEPPLTYTPTSIQGTPQSMTPKTPKDSRYALPRIVSQNCVNTVNTVKRTLSVLGDGRGFRTNL